MKKGTNINKIIGDRLRAARVSAGFKNRAEMCRQFRWPYDTYTSHEDGKRTVDRETAIKYAKALKMPINDLLALDLLNEANAEKVSGMNQGEVQVSVIPVYGQAAGGLWLEGEDMPFDDEPVLISPQAGFDTKHQYARKVVGNSVNRHVRDGEYAIFIRLHHYQGGLEPGDLVDCLRVRAGLYEHTVKVFAGNRLMTDSADLQQQISIPLDSVEADTTVEIVGVLIGSFRPFKKSYKTYQTS